MQNDFGALLPQFLAEQCQDWREVQGPGSRGNHQGIRELGQEWQAWLLLHGATHRERRALTTPWLKQALTDLGWKLSNHHGRIVVCDLSLPSRRPPVPEGPARDVAAKGFIAALKNELLLNLPPEVAKQVPLRGATPLRRPSDDEIIRRFLADCCDCEEAHPRLSAVDAGGTSLLAQRAGSVRQRLRRPRSPYKTRVLFLALARAFAQWLVEAGATPSLRRLCSSVWLKRHLVQMGYEPVHSGNGLVFLGGITLKPPVARHLPDRPRMMTVRGPDGKPTGERRPRPAAADRAARYQRYLARKEYEGRLAAGFPEHVARDVFSMNLLPVSPTALAAQEAQEARTRLADGATRYVQEHLIAEPGAVLRWSQVARFFRAFLTNEHLLANHAAQALQHALVTAGATFNRPGKARKGALRVEGFRYRVPPDPAENRVHSREVVGYAGSGSPFD